VRSRAEERSALEGGKGIHTPLIPGTFRPLANKDNDYRMDRQAQKDGRSFSGVEGFAMQDASVQESMGRIQDRTRENLVPTDQGIVMARRRLLAALELVQNGKQPPGIDPRHQRVRSVSIILPQAWRSATPPATRWCRRPDQLTRRFDFSGAGSRAIGAILATAPEAPQHVPQRRREQHGEVALRNAQRAHQVLLEQRPEQDADQDRGDVIVGLVRDVADHAEDQREPMSNRYCRSPNAATMVTRMMTGAR
jgi:hypothetical protein